MFAARTAAKASARSFSTSARNNTHVAVLGAAGKYKHARLAGCLPISDPVALGRTGQPAPAGGDGSAGGKGGDVRPLPARSADDHSYLWFTSDLI